MSVAGRLARGRSAGRHRDEADHQPAPAALDQQGRPLGVRQVLGDPAEPADLGVQRVPGGQDQRPAVLGAVRAVRPVRPVRAVLGGLVLVRLEPDQPQVAGLPVGQPQRGERGVPADQEALADRQPEEHPADLDLQGGQALRRSPSWQPGRPRPGRPRHPSPLLATLLSAQPVPARLRLQVRRHDHLSRPGTCPPRAPPGASPTIMVTGVGRSCAWTGRHQSPPDDGRRISSVASATLPDTTPQPTAEQLVRTIDQRIADELGVESGRCGPPSSCSTAASTVPFIARYRKEVTGSLDDAQLRTLEERLRYLRELEERRAAVLESIRVAGQARRRAGARRSWRPTPSPGWRTSTCRTSPSAAPRRRSPARPGWSRWPTCCSADPTPDPQAAAAGYVDADKGVADAAAALDGARVDPRRALRRGRRPDRRAARADLGAGPARLDGPGGQGGGRREVRRLLRLRRAAHASCPRTGSSRCSAARRRTSSTLTIEPGRRRSADATAGAGRPRYERPIAAPVRHRRPGPARPTAGCWTPCAGPGAPGSWSASTSTSAARLRQAAEDEAVRVFAAQPARPAARRPGRHPRRRWASTRACAPASRSPSSTRTGKVRGHRRRSTRTSRTGSGTPSLATLAALRRSARRRAGRDRQRHRVPGDRQARRRADRAGTRS